MNISKNFSLKNLNTFGIDVQAKYFSAFDTLNELLEILEEKEKSFPADPMLILGGGSNVLLTDHINGWVIRNNIQQIEVVKENDEFVYLKSGAGVNWHDLVLYSIEQGWGGIENLSLIPGKAGASPMQNIGAYGVEIKDVFYELTALKISDKTVVRFAIEDCAFGYRESIFKTKYKGQFIILDVTFRLRKKPVFNISYGAIEEELSKMGVKELSVKAVSQAVINIRTSKLPDPAVIGNAGSFFKNPTIGEEKFTEIKNLFPNISGYAVADGNVKIAAGWMIEQCGWKGFRRGDAGCHARQALVLVNYGGASGREIFDLSEEILASVYQKFGVQLEREVNIIPHPHHRLP